MNKKEIRKRTPEDERRLSVVEERSKRLEALMERMSLPAAELAKSEESLYELKNKAALLDKNLQTLDELASSEQYSDEVVTELRSEITSQQEELRIAIMDAEMLAESMRDLMLPLLIEQVAIRGDKKETISVLQDAYESEMELRNEQVTRGERELDESKSALNEAKAKYSEIREKIDAPRGDRSYKLITNEHGFKNMRLQLEDGMRDRQLHLETKYRNRENREILIPDSSGHHSIGARSVNVKELLSGKYEKEAMTALIGLQTGLSELKRDKPLFGSFFKKGEEWRKLVEDKKKEIKDKESRLEKIRAAMAKEEKVNTDFQQEKLADGRAMTAMVELLKLLNDAENEYKRINALNQRVDDSIKHIVRVNDFRQTTEEKYRKMAVALGVELIEPNEDATVK